MAQRTIQFAYRMTHIDNIEDILRVGIVKASSPNANPNYVPIGDKTAIDTRHNKRLQDGSLIGDYIPFYFGPRTPMLYVIQHGYNNVKKQDAADIVYCVIALEDVINNALDCVFTDGHALNKITRLFSGKLLHEVDKYISYDIVYAQSWNEEPDKKRKKEAELLLKNDLPQQYIRYFLVYNNAAKEKLLNLGVAPNMVRTVPHFYF